MKKFLRPKTRYSIKGGLWKVAIPQTDVSVTRFYVFDTPKKGWFDFHTPLIYYHLPQFSPCHDTRVPRLVKTITVPGETTKIKQQVK